MGGGALYGPALISKLRGFRKTGKEGKKEDRTERKKESPTMWPHERKETLLCDVAARGIVVCILLNYARLMWSVCFSVHSCLFLCTWCVCVAVLT